MKLSFGLIICLILALLFPSGLVAADTNNTSDWRGRISGSDRSSFSDSDTDEEIHFGREIAARLLGQHKMSGNVKLQKYVNLVGTSLTRNCSRPDLKFYFIVVESSEINAYSTPGGYVFVTTSLLEKMANEAELAGVLAHEIAHVSGRHVVKELDLKGAEKSAVSSIAALIGGASESVGIAFSQAVDKAVDLILRDGYKQVDEIQADVDAVMLAAFAGYNPSGFVTFLGKIAAVKQGVGKTYPRYDARLATIQRTIADEGIAGESFALNTDRFSAVMSSEKKQNPLDVLRNVTSGGKP